MSEMRAARAERLDQALGALVRRLGLEPQLARQRVLADWDRVVGPEIAARARPVRLTGGELVVAVEHAGWAQQLAFLKGTIIRDLNRAVGSEQVRDIRFVSGTGRRQGVPGAGPGTGTGERPGPGGPAGRGVPTGERVLAVAAPEAVERAEASLRGVRDPEVRRAVARWLAAAWRRRQAARLRGWPLCTHCGCPFPPAPAPLAERVCPACRARAEERVRQRVRAMLQRDPWLAYPDVAAALGPGAARLYREERAALLAEWRSQLRRLALRLRGGEAPPPEARRQLLAYAMLRAGMPPDRLDPDSVRRALGPRLEPLFEHFFGQTGRKA